MRLRPFKQVDVFTATPYLGNPLAVVLDGTGLETGDMQRLAAWTNLSETTFVLPPTPEGAAAGADYRVRIFTPGAELAFAGHPTLGSCHAWLEAGGVPQASAQIVQECQAGPVTLRRDGTRLAFSAPPLRRAPPDAALLRAVTAALGLQPRQVLAAQVLDNGTTWLGLLLDSADTLRALAPDHAALRQAGAKVGVVHVEATATAHPMIARSNREARAFGRSPQATVLEPCEPCVLVRAFAASVGVPEDPVTGSLNASLAQWLIAEGHAPTQYTASQGQALARDGQVHITQDAGGQVWVGGDCVTCITGQVRA